MGVILGKRESRALELINSIEMTYKDEGQKLVIDEAFLKKRLDDYKIMYPTLDVLGWYSSGAAHANADIPFKGDFEMQKAVL